MLDQSFSAKNFEEIFNIENRRGNINPDLLSSDYKLIIEKLIFLNEKQKSFFSKKKSDWTEDEKIEFECLKIDIQEEHKRKQEALKNYFQEIEEGVNQSSFRLRLKTKKDNKNEKDLFYIEPNDCLQFFTFKCLQRNIHRTFKVKQDNRHAIMTQLKLLLNESLPKYIIRTDITGFFEFIPQDKLLLKIDNNTLLSNKSKAFIKAILNEYESLKDKTLFGPGIGVPRGVGISSFLSEIYMKDIDKEINTRKEVLYYVRYVDDIFIILASLPDGQSLDTYYNKLKVLFKKQGLELKDVKNSDKCQLIDLYTESSKPIVCKVKYLGYQLKIKKDNKVINTIYDITTEKKLKFIKRIKLAFTHYETESKYDIKQARYNLLDCLNYISGNYRLSKYKSGVKAGIYYSNDLLDNTNFFPELTKCLRKKTPNPYVGLFKTETEREIYIEKLKKQISKIDFLERWNKRQMYDFSVSRLKEIGQWLNIEK